MSVLVARTVEGARNDFALHGAAHVGDFFGALVDEQHDEFDLRVVALDRGCDGLHDRGLAGLWRRHDDAALALTNRADEVDNSSRHVVCIRRVLEMQLRVGEQRSEVFEARTRTRLFGIAAVHRVDLKQRRVLLVTTSWTAEAGNKVTLTQTELAGELHRDVGIVAAGEVAIHSQEAIALVAQIEIARNLHWLE